MASCEQLTEMEQEYIIIQNQMKSRIDKQNRVDLSTVKSIAGVDLAYWKKCDVEYAVCCIVVIDFQSYKIIEKKEYTGVIKVPYIPGCLAFREIPLFMEAHAKLESDQDLYMFDGNGYLHPRHMGLATHAGILIGKPTIGVAKSFYKMQETEYEMPEDKPFAYTDIEIGGEVYGRALRTHAGVRPIFISIGNMIDLDTVMEAVSRMVNGESHIPLPTRLADIMTRERRKSILENAQNGSGSFFTTVFHPY